MTCRGRQFQFPLSSQCRNSNPSSTRTCSCGVRVKRPHGLFPVACVKIPLALHRCTQRPPHHAAKRIRLGAFARRQVRVQVLCLMRQQRTPAQQTAADRNRRQGTSPEARQLACRSARSASACARIRRGGVLPAAGGARHAARSCAPKSSFNLTATHAGSHARLRRRTACSGVH